MLLMEHGFAGIWCLLCFLLVVVEIDRREKEGAALVVFVLAGELWLHPQQFSGVLSQLPQFDCLRRSGC